MLRSYDERIGGGEDHSMCCNQNLKKEVKALNLVDGDSLHPLEILSDIFLSGLQKKVYILSSTVRILVSCSNLIHCASSLPHDLQ